MTKRKGRLREFERDNRVINIEETQSIRREKLQILKDEKEKENSSYGEASNKSRRDQNYRKKKRTKISLSRMILFIVILAVVLYFGNSLLKIVSLSSERKAALEYQQQLLETQELLNLRLKGVTSDSFIEQMARERLRMLKPGELLFIFGDNDNAESKDDKNKDAASDQGDTGNEP